MLPAAVFASASGGSGSAEPDILGMEKAAMARWAKGDTLGILELYAGDITYFDPFQDKRVDGLEAMRKLYGAFHGKFSLAYVEFIDAKVQRFGDTAVLTYRLVDDSVEGGKTTRHHWNVTSVYARVGGEWKIVHGHFSFVHGKVEGQ